MSFVEGRLGLLKNCVIFMHINTAFLLIEYMASIDLNIFSFLLTLERVDNENIIVVTGRLRKNF